MNLTVLLVQSPFIDDIIFPTTTLSLLKKGLTNSPPDTCKAVPAGVDNEEPLATLNVPSLDTLSSTLALVNPPLIASSQEYSPESLYMISAFICLLIPKAKKASVEPGINLNISLSKSYVSSVYHNEPTATSYSST